MTTLPSHLSHPKYRPDIDGLRAVAVLSVVAFHAFPSGMKGGFIGVDVFFVISGFLISTIIFENLERGTFSFTEFYARRVRRIFPSLSVVLLTCIGVGWLVLFPDELNQLGKHIIAGAGFVSNLVLWSEAGYFDNSAETKPLLHLWSLGIEEQFYIIWPLFLWFLWKRNFNSITFTVSIAFISFYLNIKGVKPDPVATFYSPQTRFWELLCGGILAWFLLYKKSKFSIISLRLGYLFSKIIYRKQPISNDRLFLSFISFLGFFILVYGFWRINKTLNFPGKWAIIPILGAMLIILAGPKAWVNQKILSNKIAVWFGLISFPLYLWHWPLLSFARIVENGVPARSIRILAVLLSIALAWLTMKLVEKPFRFGERRARLKVATLCGLMIAIGFGGWLISKTDFSQSHQYEKLAVKRKGFEYAFGSSLSWYRGKNDWLFLGNAYEDTVAKLKLAITPDGTRIQSIKEDFSKIAAESSKYNTKFVLFIGPNKSSVYPEYLPNGLVPSPKRYIEFFLDKLREISNLTVYDPTDDLLALKSSQGILYWMTDTHWNYKGAFLSYSGFLNLLQLPAPSVSFKNGAVHSGDLIGISKLKNFPLHAEDNWDIIWENSPVWEEKEIEGEEKTPFGEASVVINKKPLSDKYVWVVGDSFASVLRPYFNATFKEVRYVGHWVNKLKGLPSDLAKTDRKPDMVVVVKVERSF